LKYVDWKAFGRTDRLYSRQFRETTNMSALFVLDGSRSMAFPPDSTMSKFALARATVAVLSTLIIDQGDAAGILAVSEDSQGGARYVPSRSGRHHLHLCLAELARLRPTASLSIAAAVKRAGPLLRRRGLIVVVSDLYEDEQALTELRRLSRMGHGVILIHVMAQEELSLGARGTVEFEDLETGKTLLTNADAIADTYERNVARFLANVKNAATRDGVEYLRLDTSAPLEPALRRFLISRRGVN
jgi:uncharacterized protein (DUF58 family)